MEDQQSRFSPLCHGLDLARSFDRIGKLVDLGGSRNRSDAIHAHQRGLNQHIRIALEHLYLTIPRIRSIYQTLALPFEIYGKPVKVPR